MRGITWLCEASPSRLPGLNMPASPTPPGPWPPPPPPQGPGAVVAIPEEGRTRERRPTRRLPLLVLPIPWTVGGIASGGGADREGPKTPPRISRTYGDNGHWSYIGNLAFHRPGGLCREESASSEELASPAAKKNPGTHIRRIRVCGRSLARRELRWRTRPGGCIPRYHRRYPTPHRCSRGSGRSGIPLSLD
jgi:hypothetical protein